MARSFLFVPADRPERYSKALASAAHCVVIDLEDAVVPDAKETARAQLADWLSREHGAHEGARLMVRVNAPGTPWHAQDLAMLRQAGVTQLMVPKAEDAAQLDALAAHAAPGTALLALIESVAGWANMRAIAHVPAVKRLAFGSFDYCLDAGISGMGRELDAVRASLVFESRFASLPPPVDGVTLALDEPAVLIDEVAFARGFGFGGKLCIHPKQLDAVNQGFAPSPAQRDWAQRVLSACAEHPHGAFAVDGKLVDKPIVELARRLAADA